MEHCPVVVSNIKSHWRPHTIKRILPKLGRNSPCWCGSGKKYKKCHLARDRERGLLNV